ncbi:MAG: aspartate carbamoyltransferase regulatory subunit [Candidatus Pacearchaeota archaeon]
MAKELIGYIENGIVIDHLPPSIVWKVARILKIENQKEGRISLGDHYFSTRMGKKSFIKIEGRSLTPYEINLVALIAPDATINKIINGKVKEKTKAVIPERLENIVLCNNPNCITNDPTEQVEPIIYYKKGIFSCHYCDSKFLKSELKIKDF